MTARILALVLGAAALTSAHGDEAAPETAGYHLKNRSTFSSPETTRPPFWPVGWTKQMASTPAAAAEAPAAAGPLDPDQFSVTSILLGSPSLALINGQSYAVGERIRPARRSSKDKDKDAKALPANAVVYVRKISDGYVMLQSSNQVLSVPLKRPTLSEHKPEDDLPSVNDR